MEAEELLGTVKNILCNIDFEGYQPEEISTMYPLIVEMTRSFLDKCEEKMTSFISEREKDILKTVVYNFFTLGLRVICTEFSKEQLELASDQIFNPLKAKFLSPGVDVQNVDVLESAETLSDILTINPLSV